MKDALDVAAEKANDTADGLESLIEHFHDVYAGMIADTEMALEGKVNMTNLYNDRRLAVLNG